MDHSFKFCTICKIEPKLSHKIVQFFGQLWRHISQLISNRIRWIISLYVLRALLFLMIFSTFWLVCSRLRYLQMKKTCKSTISSFVGNQARKLKLLPLGSSWSKDSNECNITSVRLLNAEISMIKLWSRVTLFCSTAKVSISYFPHKYEW